MDTDGRQNLHRFSVSDGGKTLRGEPRTLDDALERAVRELLFAMRRKDGTSIGENFRHATRKNPTRPLRMLIQRFREAKAARNDALNYPLMKQGVRAIDEWVDALHGRQLTLHVTGEHTPPPAAPAAVKVA